MAKELTNEDRENIKQLKNSEIVALLSSVSTMKDWRIVYEEAIRRGMNVVMVDLE